jgi:hypothetical protein
VWDVDVELRWIFLIGCWLLVGGAGGLRGTYLRLGENVGTLLKTAESADADDGGRGDDRMQLLNS